MAQTPNQPLIGQNLAGEMARSFPTPASDIDYSGITEGNLEDYIQTVYGTPPPEGTKPNHMLVSEVPIDWKFFRRRYVTDRTNEGTYNYSISYSSEAKDFPIFTRDYIVRRANYVPKDRLTTLTGLYVATVGNQGSGYDQNTITVTLAGGTGSGGAVTAIVSAGKVTNLVITAEGNYTAAPTLTINANGSGSGATGTVSIQPDTAWLVKEDLIRMNGDQLDGLYVLVRRIYETLPGPLLAGSHIHELSGILWPYTKQLVKSGTVSGGVTGAGILALSIANAGSGFSAGTYSLGFSGGGGAGAAGTYTVTAPSPAGKIGSITMTNAGAGYTSAPTIVITGGGTGAAATVLLVGKPVATLTLVSSDATFTNAATLTITDSTGSGVGALGTATLTPTTVASVAVDAGGSGYTSATVAFSGGGGTGAAGTVNLTGNVVTSITMTDNGTGYTSRPTVVISGDGTGATGHSVLTATTVASVTLVATGNLYRTPQVTVTDGTANAVVTATIQPTSVESITLNAAGSGYSSPGLTITGGGGSGLAATVALATGSITSVSLTNAGANYTSAPTITTPSGGGTGASIVATLSALVYVEVEPVSKNKDLVLRTTVDLNSLPAKKTVPLSFRVQRSDTSLASLIILQVDDTIDVGLQETTIIGGNGPVLAFRDELYMTDSQYAAYVPSAFSISGQSITFTMTYQAASGGSAHVWTFRPTLIHRGTGAGVLELTDQKLPYGLRFVSVIYLLQSY